MSKKNYIYSEYTLRNKILDNIGLNNYIAKLEFTDNKNFFTKLIIISEFKKLVKNNEYIVYTTSSIIKNNINIESLNGYFNQKVIVNDIENQDPFQLVKNVLFNKVKTTFKNETIRGHKQISSLDTISIKLWESNKLNSKLNSKQTSPAESASTTTSSDTSCVCNDFGIDLCSCSSTTAEGTTADGTTTEGTTCTYGTVDCYCSYTIGDGLSEERYSVESGCSVTINGDLTIEGTNNFLQVSGNLIINGNVYLNGTTVNLSTSGSGSITINNGDLNISGSGSYFANGGGSSTDAGTITINGNLNICSGGSILNNSGTTCTINGYLCSQSSSGSVTNNGTFSYYDSNVAISGSGTSTCTQSSCTTTSEDCGCYTGCDFSNCPSSSSS